MLVGRTIFSLHEFLFGLWLLFGKISLVVSEKHGLVVGPSTQEVSFSGKCKVQILFGQPTQKVLWYKPDCFRYGLCY